MKQPIIRATSNLQTATTNIHFHIFGLNIRELSFPTECLFVRLVCGINWCHFFCAFVHLFSQKEWKFVVHFYWLVLLVWGTDTARHLQHAVYVLLLSQTLLQSAVLCRLMRRAKWKLLMCEHCSGWATLFSAELWGWVKLPFTLESTSNNFKNGPIINNLFLILIYIIEWHRK